MPTERPQKTRDYNAEMASELAESWINGNRSDVLEAINASSPAKAAWLALEIAEQICTMCDEWEAHGFRAALGRNLESQEM